MCASVISETASFVTKITLNSPETGNVVNNDNLPLLHGFLEEAIASSECRVIVIQGRDGIFCRGMDFNNAVNSAKGPISKEWSAPYKSVVTTIRNSPKPVIAKADGDVLAGGMGILLACDIILATERSIFGLSEILFGLIPAYVYPLLLDRLPFKKARFLVLSSKRMNAVEAHDHGIIDELVPDEKIEKVTKDYIKRLLFSSPEALALTKTYSDTIWNRQFSEAIDIAQEQLTGLLNNKDTIAAIEQFLDGEKPPWAVPYRPNKKK
jgi:methylglutaconyl-CoA hydratase